MQTPPDALLLRLGKAMVPYLAPMGIQADNWPAAIALLSGAVAKEVVVATLEGLYTGSMSWLQASSGWWDTVHASGQLLLTRLQALFVQVSHPWQLSAAGQLSSQAEQALQQHFHTPAVAYAYLLFTLLYLPCVSTVAAIAKEIGARWACFAVFWSFALAYAVSVFAMQWAKQGSWAMLPYILVLLLALWLLHWRQQQIMTAVA